MTKLDTAAPRSDRRFAERRQISLPVFTDVTRRTAGRDQFRQLRHDVIERANRLGTALATEVLRVANSAFSAGFFGDDHSCGGPAPGVQARHQSGDPGDREEPLRSRPSRNHYDDARSLRHSSACALASDWIAQRARYAHISGEAFIGGLIHDIGKLFFFVC